MGIVDSAGRDVDHALLGPDPAQLRVADEVVLRSTHVGEERGAVFAAKAWLVVFMS